MYFCPSQVLYIKNVHRRVTSDDLMSLFGRFSTTAKSSEGVKIRLLSGRMRGQAFVEFKCTHTIGTLLCYLV